MCKKQPACVTVKTPDEDLRDEQHKHKWRPDGESWQIDEDGNPVIEKHASMRAHGKKRRWTCRCGATKTTTHNQQ